MGANALALHMIQLPEEQRLRTQRVAGMYMRSENKGGRVGAVGTTGKGVGKGGLGGGSTFSAAIRVAGKTGIRHIAHPEPKNTKLAQTCQVPPRCALASSGAKNGLGPSSANGMTLTSSPAVITATGLVLSEAHLISQPKEFLVITARAIDKGFSFGNRIDLASGLLVLLLC